jgi:eukaryotic-like serine/threonine-protein kinase
VSGVDRSGTDQEGIPRPGDVLAGRFRVERVLGAGGMGVVVAAHHLQLDRRVALKFLLPEVAKQESVVTRFAREARAAARIQSEHVARVLDVGSLEDGRPYLVMEYLEGRDLEAEVQARGPLPVSSTVDWVLEACEALAEAHAVGIVHRDLKPANLFLTRRADGGPLVKVLDFGISKNTLLEASGQAGPALTQTFAQLGSPRYMSPEQLRSSKDVDARADIWALGLILHELLTGDTAFDGTTLPELHVAILTQAPRPVRSIRPDVPVELEAAISHCLEKEPARRFANVAELARAILPFGTAQARQSAERIARVLGAAPIAPAADDRGRVAAAPVGAGGPPPAGPQGPVAPTLDGSASGFGPGPGAGTSAQFGPGPSMGGPQGGAPPPPPQAYGPPPGTGTYGAGPPGMPGPQAMAPYGQQPMGMSMPGMPNPYGGPPIGMPGPMGMSYIQQQPQPGTSTTTVVLVVVACVLLLGMGSCMVCVCAGAASQQSGANELPSRDHAAQLAER